MKSMEVREKFISMRAAGKSYRTISDELEISRSTCEEWEKLYSERIASLKAEELAHLYECYGMMKEGRIRHLGSIIQKIDAAIENADLSEVPPEKLLDLKLKYNEALMREYTPPSRHLTLREPSDIMAALEDLLQRVRDGDIPADMAARESMVLSNMVKAYENTELKDKLDALEMAMNVKQEPQIITRYMPINHEELADAIHKRVSKE